LVVEHDLEAADLTNRTRAAAAAYLGGQPNEVALVDSTTQGLALIYHGLRLAPGQEILTTTHDHYATHEAIRLAIERSGAKTRRIALYEAPHIASRDEIVARLRRAIRPETRVVGLTWVHSSTGVTLPIRQLADAVADANRGRADRDRALLIVDGVHGFGSKDHAAAELGCDFFAAGTHKWIFAPRGTGIVWARAENWALVRPTIPTFSAFEPYVAWMDQRAPDGPTQASWVSPGGFKPYEHQWAMAEAFDFHRRIGRGRVAERIAALNSQCKEGLARIPGVTLHTPSDPALSAGIICFDVAGLKPDVVVKRLLAKKVIASQSPYKLSHARLAPSLVNTEEEVDTALAAVRSLS